MYTRANLTVGVNGDAPDEMVRALQAPSGRCRQGPPAARVAVEGKRPSGLEVEILEKDTRATAISFGFPIDVNRAHPDFAALSVVRSWLGEHRIASGRLYQRIREVRGMNYGDYAYIEAFPRGMFQFFPDPNMARQKQIFEIWIRPVVPVNAHMSLRIAIYELDKLIQDGLTEGGLRGDARLPDEQRLRDDRPAGPAARLRARFAVVRHRRVHRFHAEALQNLTVEQVNAALKRHLSARNLSVVYITKDAAGLKQALVSDAFSPIRYDGEKPPALLAEDRIIGALKLNIPAANVRVTSIEDVFAR